MLLLLPVLTGILVAISFPRVGLGYLAWVAYIPLIAFVFKTGTSARAFLGGFIAGFVALFALLLWIPDVLIRHGGFSTFLAWFAFGLLVSVLACYPAAACALTKYLTRRGGATCFLLFPAVWIVLEYAQSLSPFGGLPWILAGYSQSDCLSIIQIVDITGIFGVSFIILWAGTAFVWMVTCKGNKMMACAPLLGAILLISACLIYGRISLRHWESAPAPFRVAMLQGNLSFDDPEFVLAEKYRKGYVRMADTLKPGETDLLVLPESPSPLSFQYEDSYRRVLADLARRYSLGLIFNTIRSSETADGSAYFNSAYFLDHNGTLTGIYDKIHLVPFGEYIPLSKLFTFAETITKDVGSFSPGKDVRVLKLGDHPVNALICFEAVFPDLARRFVQKGSQLMVNLTNDGWYGDSAAPYQHLAIARVRSVENRRYLLRATNSGISAIIEPSGRMQASTALLHEAIGMGHFAFIEEMTLYTRYGDVFVFLCAIISGAVWIFVEFHRAVNLNRRTMED
jgi:apolipoprotein N-acyltransferase